MSSAGIVPPSEATAKSPRKRARSTKKTVPTLSDLILKAVAASTERGGMSLPALKKALKDGGYDVTKNKTRILITVRRLVSNKSLIQTSGTGASGSFKLNKEAPAPQKKKVVKKKKAKKVKRASAKKETADGTPPAKKSLKKRRKVESPKKAKKPAAAKLKKAKIPKKSKQRLAKSTRTRSSVKK